MIFDIAVHHCRVMVELVLLSSVMNINKKGQSVYPSFTGYKGLPPPASDILYKVLLIAVTIVVMFFIVFFLLVAAVRGGL